MTVKQLKLLQSAYQSAHASADLVAKLWDQFERKEDFEPNGFYRLATFTREANAAATELANIEAGLKPQEIRP